MAYALDPSMAPSDALQRAVAEQFDAARGFLAVRGPGIHGAIHDARRAIRRIRAVLQLRRPALGEDYAAMVTPLREAGWKLSALRDAESVIEALDKLGKRDPEVLAKSERVALRERLVRRRNAVLRASMPTLAEADTLLEAAAAQAPVWLHGAEFPDLLDGFRRTYARGRRALATAAETRDPEAVHRWRQRVREHWLHLDLLRPLWPEVISAHAGETRRLSQILGSERDLLLLEAVVRRARRPLGPRRGNAAVAARLSRSREALAVQGWDLGARVFAERPRELARRLARWHAATRSRS